MLLTIEEFNRIRPLRWSVKSFLNDRFNTTDTPQLFWIDFIRKIFQPYYINQQTITNITNFDLNQIVLIDDNLNLKLPVELETAIYAARNQFLIKPFFSVGINKFIILLVIIVLMVIILIVDYSKYFQKYKYII